VHPVSSRGSLMSNKQIMASLKLTVFFLTGFVACTMSGLNVSAQDAQSTPSQDTISTTILDAVPDVMTAEPPRNAVKIKRGDISLNFPSSDVRTVARAVLGDLLHLPYSVGPGITTAVTVVTPKPIARGSVLPFLEESLRASNLALVRRVGGYSIESVDQARASGAGAGGGDGIGFGTETIQLQYVNAGEIRRVIDSVLPGVVTQADPGSNTLTISGATGQRASARALLQQFDVNWLRNMSFALYVPRKTDSRLIVPELEKLLNAPDAPTRDLVRLISMEQLNGILAISKQRNYLDDVGRFIEVLDREGQNNEPRLFVYRVQNGRSRDLVRTLRTAFGLGGASDEVSGDPSRDVQFSQSPDGNGREDSNRGNRGQSGSFGGSNRNDGGTTGGQSRQPDYQAVSPPNDGGAGGNGGSNRTFGINANISSDETNNAIVVFGTPREYAIVEDALHKLDIVPQQVLIEAAITEVNLNNDLRYGLQWNFTRGGENAVLTESNNNLNLIRNTPGFSFAFSPSSTINGVLNTLESKTRVNVVSAPKLLVLNNQTAVLQVGDEVPVATQNSTSNIDPNAPTINAIEYRNTGVILKVTPRVNANGIVMLDVTQEVSDVNTNVSSVSGINSPTISTRRISSTVAVRDGEVLALGGLIRNMQTRGNVGLPFLSRIPVLGGLFGRQTRGGNKVELIVLIKPRVIRTTDDGRAMTDDLIHKIKALEPWKGDGQVP
jgi:general secretion pathway protein D